MNSLLAQRPVFLGAFDGVAEGAVVAPSVAGPSLHYSPWFRKLKLKMKNCKNTPKNVNDI